MGLAMEGVVFPWAGPPHWARGARQAGGPRLGAQVGVTGTWGWGMALGRPRLRCVRVPRAARGGTPGWRGARPWLLNGLRELSLPSPGPGPGSPSPGGPVSWGLWVGPAAATSGTAAWSWVTAHRGEVRRGAGHSPDHSRSGAATCRAPLGALAGPHQEASVQGPRAPQAPRPSCGKRGAAGQLLVTESPRPSVAFGLFPGLAATHGASEDILGCVPREGRATVQLGWPRSGAVRRGRPG